MKTSSYEESFDSAEIEHEKDCDDVFTKCVNYETSVSDDAVFAKCVNYEYNVSVLEESYESEHSSAQHEIEETAGVASWQPDSSAQHEIKETVEVASWQPDVIEEVDESVSPEKEVAIIEAITAVPQQEIVENIVKVESATPIQETYTASAPPPVPKRTLLPADPKTKSTTKHEPLETEAVSQYVTPTSTVASTPQHEKSLVENVDVQNVKYRDIELVSRPDSGQKVEAQSERWSDSTSVSLPGQVEDVETVSSDPGNAQCEPVSEMYYTASSEVSLLSDTDQDKVHDDEDKDDKKLVIAGHVAAMRERFESMTRANTPCPDLVRSLSPSLEVFRNISPSPDKMA